MSKGILLIAFLCSLLQSTWAQVKGAQPDRVPSNHGRQFDVVSIRPSNSESIRFYGVRDDEYRARNVPLWITILHAYLPATLVAPERLIGAPSWVWNEDYDLEGKVGESDMKDWREEVLDKGSTNPKPLLQSMLQGMLSDRCQLAVHTRPTTMQGFALVLDKHGPNLNALKRSIRRDATPSDAVNISNGGSIVPIMPNSEPIVTLFHTSMESLAEFLSNGAIVQDMTGLKGEFDFSLTRTGTGEDIRDDWDMSALGLKLISVKLQSVSIVVDHIQRPSTN